jgi:hypothetical protein
MTIRDYTPEDQDALVRMYLQGNSAFRFPELDDPIFLVKKVLEHEGRARMAVLARATTEIYLFMDHRHSKPAWRWDNFQHLHRAAETALLEQGMDDAHCWLPPEIERRFGRRLRTLDWIRDNDFTPYCKYLVPDREPRVQLTEVSDGTRI